MINVILLLLFWYKVPAVFSEGVPTFPLVISTNFVPSVMIA